MVRKQWDGRPTLNGIECAKVESRCNLGGTAPAQVRAQIVRHRVRPGNFGTAFNG